MTNGLQSAALHSHQSYINPGSDTLDNAAQSNCFVNEVCGSEQQKVVNIIAELLTSSMLS